MKLLSLCIAPILSTMLGCASRPPGVAPPATIERQTDVSYLVPDDVSFAKGFVQFLSDAGWQVNTVRPSKFNGFFHETDRAAWIQTVKGTLEVVFFDSDATVAQILISENGGRQSDDPKYIIQTSKTSQRIEGAVTYFTKHRNMLIITIDHDLNDELHRLLAASTHTPN
ncbi:MAG: hypothetical protein ABR501_05400 [Pyrinomonadaceae bacterium]